MNTDNNVYRSPVLLSKLTIAGIVVYALGLIAASVATPFWLGSLQAGTPLEAGSLLAIVTALIGLIRAAAYSFTVVTFLMWLFRTFKNLPAIDSDYSDISPGWAVGWWFIPLANLIKPFQAVRDVWLESDPDTDPADQMFSVRSGAPGFISLWWAFWIIGNITSNIIARVAGLAGPRDFTLIISAVVFEAVVWLIAAILVVRVIRSITMRQEASSVTRRSRTSINTPPPPPVFESPQGDPVLR